MPQPRELLKGEDWDRRWRESRDKVDLVSLESETQPALGLEILEVFPGFQGERLGLKVGERLVKFNKTPVMGTYQLGHIVGNRAGTYEIWSRDRGVYSLESGQGRLGVYLRNVWHPEFGYLRSRERDPKWDAFVAVAALRWETDPVVAETALFHAFQAGYRGWLLPSLMCAISKEDLRFRTALDFGWFAKGQIPEDQNLVIGAYFSLAAILMGQLELGLKANKEWGPYAVLPEGWEGRDQAALLKDLSDSERNGPSPCTVAANCKVPPQPLQALNANSEILIQRLRNDHKAAFDLPPPKDVTFILGPGGRDMDFLVDTDLGAFLPKLANNPVAMEFALMDVSRGIEEEILQLTIYPDQKIVLSGPGLLALECEGIEARSKKSHRVELAARGRVREARIDDRCVSLSTTEDYPDRQLVLFMKLWSVQGAVTRVDVTPLDNPKEAAAEKAKPLPPAATDLKIPGPPSDPVLKWYYSAILEGYLARGHRSSAWDQAAVDGLLLSLPFFRDSDHLADVAEIVATLGRAIEAGCNDPLVLAAQGSALYQTERRKAAAVRLYRRGAEGLLSSKHSAALRFHAVACAASGAKRSLLNADLQKADALAEAALALIPEAVAEEGAPSDLLMDGLMFLISSLPEARRDSEMAYHRVWLAGEKTGKGKAALLGMKGKFFIEYAWTARGGGWGSDVKSESWKLFENRLSVAAESLAESWRLDPKNRLVPPMMLTVALGHEETRKDVQLWLSRSFEAWPNNRPAVERYLWFLAPRWFGSKEDMLNAGREFLALAKRDNLDASIASAPLAAWQTYSLPNTSREATPNSASFFVEENLKSEEAWKDIREVFEVILKRNPNSAYYRSLYAAWAGGAENWKVAREQFEFLGDRIVPMAFTDQEGQDRIRAKAFQK